MEGEVVPPSLSGIRCPARSNQKHQHLERTTQNDDHHSELSALGADVFGLSVQDTEYQREMVERLHLPFLVLSDANFKFCELMRLPTFEVSGMRLLKRVTMIAENNSVVGVHYPIFPSDSDAKWVIDQLPI